jgi:hypothetical protein
VTGAGAAGVTSGAEAGWANGLGVVDAMGGFGTGVDGPATGCTTSGISETSGTDQPPAIGAIGAGSSTSIGVSSSVCDEGSSSAGMFRTARGGEPITVTRAAGADAEVPSSEDPGG